MFTMKHPLFVYRFLFAVGLLVFPSLLSCMVLTAQTPAANDTVVLTAAQVKSVDIKCLVTSSYGSGDEELLAINSQSDVESDFGYNCDIPDTDYTNYTLLCCSIMANGEVKTKVKMVGENIILFITANKGSKRNLLHLLIPKMGPNGSVHLDVSSPSAPGSNR
jgi:hypothetical protein